MNQFPIRLVLESFILAISALLMLVILLQTPKSTSGLGGTLGGGSDSGGGYRTKRGVEKKLFQITIGFAALYILLSLVIIKVS
jgi:preprotein translocase subunit SecG